MFHHMRYEGISYAASSEPLTLVFQVTWDVQIGAGFRVYPNREVAIANPINAVCFPKRTPRVQATR